ncbi:MAG: aminotransferase class I/II-fold pyridoxal phosphate-dependent enzyme [Alphaproteobacteria bacterium]|nr:aminotransferase class I/II-fold pyridoxal phosphate-dependent enzyme [Alphaproteobacteria bacterium]
MEQDKNVKPNRREFFARTGRGAGVLALSPLLAGIASPGHAAGKASGPIDFDTPFNRIGSDSVHWDMPIRTENMSHIVAALGIADMDFRAAPVITAELRKRLSLENWGYLDMGSPNPKAFVKGILDWNRKRYGVTVANEGNLGITTGVHSGIIATMRAYSPPGSKVLMATPIYNGFYSDLRATKTVANESLMKYANGSWEIDWADFEAKAAMPDTKVSILCNPQNPVGRVWTQEELTRYGEICLKHNVLVLSDEIHCDFINKGQKFIPFSTLPNKAIVDNSISYMSASKSFSLAGMKAAWFFSTNPEVFKATSFYNHPDLNTLGMYASKAAHEGGEGWLNQCVAYIDGNHAFANAYIKANIPMIKVGNKPEGTYLTWLDVGAVADKIGARKLADDANQQARDAAAKAGTDYSGRQSLDTVRTLTPEDMVRKWMAKNAFVYLNEGSSYGLGGANHMRMNLATSRRMLKAALDSMAGALKNLA